VGTQQLVAREQAHSLIIKRGRVACGCCAVPPPQEGTGAAAVSAYVEVVFDNSDGRFPVSLGPPHSTSQAPAAAHHRRPLVPLAPPPPRPSPRASAFSHTPLCAVRCAPVARLTRRRCGCGAPLAPTKTSSPSTASTSRESTLLLAAAAPHGSMLAAQQRPVCAAQLKASGMLGAATLLWRAGSSIAWRCRGACLSRARLQHATSLSPHLPPHTLHPAASLR
jgi:hypothetical protein